MDPFLAEIIMFGGNFAPRGWAYCDGQLMPISQYSAVFSLLGTTYGGDGRTTFALPDMRGRVAMHPGNGPGLTSRRLGAKGGVESVTLNVTEIPSHTHTSVIRTAEEDPNTDEANGAHLTTTNDNFYYSGAADANSSLAGPLIGNTGGNLPHTNVQPFLCVNYIIALQGVFPSRS